MLIEEDNPAACGFGDEVTDLFNKYYPGFGRKIIELRERALDVIILIHLGLAVYNFDKCLCAVGFAKKKGATLADDFFCKAIEQEAVPAFQHALHCVMKGSKVKLPAPNQVIFRQP